MSGISEADRVLRWITILTWIPAFAVLVPCGVFSRGHNAPLYLLPIPMTFSAIWAMIQLSHRTGSRAAGTKVDIFIALFMFGLGVPSIVFLRRARYYYWPVDTAGGTMLGTFGVSAMMVNFCIHIYFIIRQNPILTLLGRFCRGIGSSSTCPHCQRDLRLLWDFSHAPSTHSSESKDSYAPVSMVEDAPEGEAGPSTTKDPKPSTDDETARLV